MSIRRLKERKDEGFSLIEVLLGIALMGIAMLGLAQLFVMSVWNNRRADVISNATYLAQQEIDSIRTLTPEELASLPVVNDETIDVNQDGTNDFRRITTVDHNNFYYKVLVFGAEQLSTDQGALIADPAANRILAQMGTIINR